MEGDSTYRHTYVHSSVPLQRADVLDQAAAAAAAQLLLVQSVVEVLLLLRLLMLATRRMMLLLPPLKDQHLHQTIVFLFPNIYTH